MATPALRLIRDRFPGAFIGGLVRPGLNELLAGTSFFDEIHVERASGVMGPKRVAAKIRPRAYEAALLLTNSFSTALITRLAFIPRRIGYDRDARGVLLTDRLKAERRGPMGTGGFACVPAVDYYLHAARAVTGPGYEAQRPPALELAVTPEQTIAGAQVLARAGVHETARFVVLNPGASDSAKRWPPERYAQVAARLSMRTGVVVLVSGSPGEAELVDAVVTMARHEVSAHASCTAASPAIVSLVRAGITLGSLKHVLQQASLLVTNDTGPRHIACAMGTPTVTLFGPTDPRWTTLPPSAGKPIPRVEITADPTLPPDQMADDHPERCRIDRIETEEVWRAVLGVIQAS